MGYRKRILRSLRPIRFVPADAGGVVLCYNPKRLLVDISGPIARLATGRKWARLFERECKETIRKATFWIKVLRVSLAAWEEVTDG